MAMDNIPHQTLHWRNFEVEQENESSWWLRDPTHLYYVHAIKEGEEWTGTVWRSLTIDGKLELFAPFAPFAGSISACIENVEKRITFMHENGWFP